MTTHDVDESKELTRADSLLLLKFKTQPPEYLRERILVGRLQRVLVSRGHTHPLSVDGHYGPHTDEPARLEAESEKGLTLGPELARIIKEYRWRKIAREALHSRVSRLFEDTDPAVVDRSARTLEEEAAIVEKDDLESANGLLSAATGLKVYAESLRKPFNLNESRNRGAEVTQPGTTAKSGSYGVDAQDEHGDDRRAEQRRREWEETRRE